MDNPLLHKVAEDVNNELARYIGVRSQQSIRHESHKQLWNSLRQVSLGGGKRLRPYLMVLAYLASGAAYDKKLIPVATAWELIHQCMLIHDDIIDRDTVRHGQPNISGEYRERYKKIGVAEDSIGHYADSAALLAGDLALSGAYQLILESTFDHAIKSEVLQTFGQALDAVALGELQDTEAAFMTSENKNALLIAELKTASYSFVGPLKSGAQLADMDTLQVTKFVKYGTALGIAFQLRDDWLGVFGNPDVYGKSVSSDIFEGKRTLLVEFAYDLSDSAGKTVLDNTLGNLHATPDQVEAVRNIMDKSGARQKVESEIDSYTMAAHTVLSSIEMPDVVRKHFQDLEAQLLHRQQ